MDGIDGVSMCEAQRVVDAAVAHGARLTLRSLPDDLTLATLSIGKGPERFTLAAVGETHRDVILKLWFALISETAGRRFLTAEQVMKPDDVWMA